MTDDSPRPFGMPTQRTPVELDADTGQLRIGSHARPVPDPSESSQVYSAYLSLLYAVRGARPGEQLSLRSADIEALLLIVGDDPDTIQQRLIGLMGCTADEATALSRVLLRHRKLTATLGIAAGLSLGLGAVASGTLDSPPAQAKQVQSVTAASPSDLRTAAGSTTGLHAAASSVPATTSIVFAAAEAPTSGPVFSSDGLFGTGSGTADGRTAQPDRRRAVAPAETAPVEAAPVEAAPGGPLLDGPGSDEAAPGGPVLDGPGSGEVPPGGPVLDGPGSDNPGPDKAAPGSPASDNPGPGEAGPGSPASDNPGPGEAGPGGPASDNPGPGEAGPGGPASDNPAPGEAGPDEAGQDKAGPGSPALDGPGPDAPAPTEAGSDEVAPGSPAPSVPPPAQVAPSVPPPAQVAPSVPPPAQVAPSVPPPAQVAPSVPPPAQVAPSVPPPAQVAPSVPPPAQVAPSVPPPAQVAPSTPPQAPDPAPSKGGDAKKPKGGLQDVVDGDDPDEGKGNESRPGNL